MNNTTYQQPVLDVANFISDLILEPIELRELLTMLILYELLSGLVQRVKLFHLSVAVQRIQSVGGGGG